MVVRENKVETTRFDLPKFSLTRAVITATLSTTHLFDTCLAIDYEPCVVALVSFEESTALFGQLIYDFCHNPDLLHADIAGMVLILVLRHESAEGPIPLVIPGFSIASKEDVRTFGGLDHAALHGNRE
jgi:uncharacterized OB-fold protein